ncbi:MAG: NAD+ synthase [Planctomycetota bacterium]
MRVALCQINTTVADLDGNRRQIEAAHQQAMAGGAELTVFPELTLPGYPPLDLLDRDGFVRDCERALAELAGNLTTGCAVVGTLRRNSSGSGRFIHNSAAVIENGAVVGFHDKVLLPTYDVFDEARYFESGGEVSVFDVAGRRVGVAICEDLWSVGDFSFRKRYQRDPGAELQAAGAEFIVSPSASPFHRGKVAERDEIFRAQSARLGVPILLCNQVGGNTELIFDGNSLVAVPQHGIVARGPSFAAGTATVDVAALPAAAVPLPAAAADEIADALVIGVRDYFAKCGFRGAVIGLSGGIDSAVTAAVACEALGPEAVRGVAMPSRYSSQGSIDDAAALADALGIRFDTISIEPLFEAYLAALGPCFEGTEPGVAEENLQARARGALLMALSNKFGDVVLTTGNKSELAVGYCTLYGDMCGGLAVLGDVPKTDVYAIARLPRYPQIPESTIDKPPSAELRPDQTDQDSLPPYDVLDPILEAFVERSLDLAEIVALGFDERTVHDVVRLVERNEYKRRQSAPTLRVTPRAFGMGRRFPIARKF